MPGEIPGGISRSCVNSYRWCFLAPKCISGVVIIIHIHIAGRISNKVHKFSVL